MFSMTVKVERGKCVRCKQAKEEPNRKLYVLDISGENDLKLMEAESDNAACLKCWNFIGLFLVNRVRVTEVVIK